MARSSRITNPFRYGDLALDRSFTNRTEELRELRSDIRNGQNVVVFAPRRYGKSSLIWRATHELVRSGEVLVAQVDLMKTPTKARLAEKLAESIYEDVTSPLLKVRDKAVAVFRSLRIAPVVTVSTDGSLAFSFQAAQTPEDIDATLEHLLRLPAELAAERGRQVALVFDEFQEVVEIDRRLLSLMRSVFQEQPEVAHVYLGSKRHMMTSIFNDENEPFWRSAKQMELGVIPRRDFAKFIRSRFEQTSRSVEEAVIESALDTTHAHPYGTQELAYALWEVTPEGGTATRRELQQAMVRVLRSENAHFSRIWERAPKAQRLTLEALGADPGQPPFSTAFRRRHGLPAASTVQKAIEALVNDELIERHAEGYRIAEPFLAEWLRRDGL